MLLTATSTYMLLTATSTYMLLTATSTYMLVTATSTYMHLLQACSTMFTKYREANSEDPTRQIRY